jgi:hypothetical protein
MRHKVPQTPSSASGGRGILFGRATSEPLHTVTETANGGALIDIPQIIKDTFVAESIVTLNLFVRFGHWIGEKESPTEYAGLKSYDYGI